MDNNNQNWKITGRLDEDQETGGRTSLGFSIVR